MLSRGNKFKKWDNSTISAYDIMNLQGVLLLHHAKIQLKKITAYAFKMNQFKKEKIKFYQSDKENKQ